MFLSKIRSSLFGEKPNKNAPATAAPVTPVPTPAPVTPPPRSLTAAELKQRIRVALDGIAGITYEAEVPAATIDPSAHPAAKPVSFLVTKDGRPVLAIVVVAANTYKSMPVMGTKLLVEGRGIPYMRFFVERENDPAYIADRLSRQL